MLWAQKPYFLVDDQLLETTSPNRLQLTGLDAYVDLWQKDEGA